MNIYLLKNHKVQGTCTAGFVICAPTEYSAREHAATYLDEPFWNDEKISSCDLISNGCIYQRVKVILCDRYVAR